MAKGGTIHFVCIADAHVTAERRSDSDTITIVSGRWAFCPTDAKREGHEWHETEGLTIESLRSGLTRTVLARLPAEERGR